MTNKELIAGLCSGDKESFRYLVEQYQDKVFSLAYSFVKTRQEAEDIAQEVFIEVFKSINKFRKESELSSWIYRITVNKSLNIYKRIKRQSVQEDMELFAHRSNEEGQNPEKTLQQKQNAEALNFAINKLPEKQKIAYTLRHFNGLSYKEISEIINKSKSSVESLIHRAHKKLYALLYDYYEENMK